MRCVSAEFFLDLEWREGETLHLAVESPAVMGQIVSELSAMGKGEDGSFIFSEGNKDLRFESAVEVIVDPFGIDFNSRTILNKLYAEIVRAEEPFVLEKAEINAKLLCYLEKVTAELAYDGVSFDLNLDTAKLLKMYDVRVSSEYMSLLEKLIEYIKLTALLLMKKVLIFVNLKSYLTFGEINELKKMAQYYKVFLLLIDSCESPVINDDIMFIIDTDRCIIKK